MKNKECKFTEVAKNGPIKNGQKAESVDKPKEIVEKVEIQPIIIEKK